MQKKSVRLNSIVAPVAKALTGVLLCSALVQAEDMNPVIGKAGDYVLREADLDRLLSSQSPEARSQIERNPDQRANFVRQVLLSKATAAKARKEGFDKKPETRELLSILVDQFLAQEYLNKVVLADVTVSDDELKKYYAEHQKDFLIPDAVKVRHIYIESPKDTAVESREKAKLKAEGILQQLAKGEDFAKLAAEKSEDPDSASKGGDLGYITAGKTNSTAFETAVFALKAGETSKVIETPFGYHIVRADDRKDARTATIDEAREYITSQLKEENRKLKIQEFLEKLAKETGLEVAGENPVKPGTAK